MVKFKYTTLVSSLEVKILPRTLTGGGKSLRFYQEHREDKRKQNRIRGMVKERRSQINGELVFSKRAFSRVIREIAWDLSLKKEKVILKWEKDALNILQSEAESYLVELFAKANKTCVYTGRVIVTEEDMRFAEAF